MKIMTVDNIKNIIKNENNLIGTGKEGKVYIYDDNKVVRISRTKKKSAETYIYTNLDNKFILHSKEIKFINGLCYNFLDRALCDVDFLIFQSKIKLKKEDRINLCKNICKGVKFLHDFNIVHGDIKPKNILYYEKDIIKLSDFGMSFIIEKNKEKENKSFYTQRYKSKDEHVGKYTDIWALACTLFEVYYKKRYNPDLFYKKDKLFDDMFLNMTKLNKDERYTIDDVLKHDIFN